MAVSDARYTAVAVTLHWVMGLAFLFMLASGFGREYLELDKSLKSLLMQWHKATGVLLLLGFVLRIGWRLLHRPPALPLSLPRFERIGAKAGHWLLYATMFVMPFSGWVMSSASGYSPSTDVFGWFQWPHVPNLEGEKAIGGFAHSSHLIVAWVFTGLIAAHILAVIKHAVVDKQNLLTRMWYGKGA